MSQGALREVARDSVASAVTHLEAAGFGTRTSGTIYAPQPGTVAKMSMRDAAGRVLIVTVEVYEPGLTVRPEGWL
jgi:hypothetical protein